MGDDQERRSHPRFDCVLVATIEIEGVAPVRGRVTNISMSGVSVMTDDALAQGTKVTFQLRLVRSWTENDFLKLPGEVVRSSELGAGHQIAGRFDEDMAPHAKELLGTLVRMLAAQFEMKNAVGGKP